MQKKLEKQRAFFRSGRTIPLAFRKKALKRLGRAIRQHENEIYAALREDLNKSKTEAFMCEVGMTLAELSYMLKHLEGWAKKKYVRSPLAQFSATSFTVKEPYGVALIMSPWNYPFMLTMEPLIGAIAAGNCAVVKPSAYAPATSAVIRRILRACFPEEYIFAVEGGRAENQALLDQRFDYIFFTGGVTVGKEVMAKAAKHLTPVTLELGGKSPCVVDRTAKLELAAKRIAFGKLLNAGQTCVAPDYVLVAREVEDAFVAALQKQFDQLCPDPLHSAEYVHIVNQKHFDRLTGLMASGQIVYGGSIDPAALRIAPTILRNVSPDSPVMQEEIFGPILPILPVSSIDEAIAFAAARPHPLACYLFTKDRALQRRVLDTLPFGGGCINDTIIHLATSAMPFGGVGESGMGGYHGRAGFETFSHYRSIVDKKTWTDLPIRYQRYDEMKEKMLRRFLK